MQPLKSLFSDNTRLPDRRLLRHLLLALLPALPQLVQAAKLPDVTQCLATATPEIVQLDYVVDGDTLALSNKQKVRIIGINTPEPQPKPQPYANEATAFVRQLLAEQTSLWLYPGVEAADRHGRALAHVVTSDGTNLAEQLLQHGLAASSAVSPNTRCAEHYHSLEQSARSKNIGIWSRTHPWQIIDKRINKKNAGFRLVTATVERINEDKHYHHVYLSNGLRLYMTNKLAKSIRAKQLMGKRITARGWMQLRKNKTAVRLHHPSNLHVHSD